MDQDTYNILNKRFQTTMIGALYQFEQHFGHLWGIDLADDQITSKHNEYLDKWELVRNNILNNGNNQFRKTIDELSKTHNHSNMKYKYYFNNRKGQSDEK